MFVFELPEIGEGVVEGEIVRWLVQEGQAVAVDQPICEIMTDKATVEITTPKAGVVSTLHGVDGDVIKVHTPLVDIDEDGTPSAEAPKAAPSAPAAPTPAAPPAPKATPPAPVASPTPKAAAPQAPVPVPMPRTGGKTLATPAVRSHARSMNVDIDQVAGSGKGGRITRSDIDAFVAHPTAVKAPPALQLPAGPLPTGPVADERVRIIGLRRKIAEKMTESYRTIPHFTYVEEVDATRMVQLRGALKETAAAYGVKITYLAFIMRALVRVFRMPEFRAINANMDEEKFELLVRGEINIGIATDTPAGLYVPVVKNVEQKSLFQIAHDVVDVTSRTRENKVQLSELQGGTFTITSVGNIGGRFATPIINHPEVAILGVNQIHDRPMVVNGEVVPRKMMYLSPSFDHRVIDGAVGARFVAALKALLENPEPLLLDL